jgi:hypothetical protein
VGTTFILLSFSLISDIVVFVVDVSHVCSSTFSSEPPDLSHRMLFSFIQSLSHFLISFLIFPRFEVPSDIPFMVCLKVVNIINLFSCWKTYHLFLNWYSGYMSRLFPWLKLGFVVMRSFLIFGFFGGFGYFLVDILWYFSSFGVISGNGVIFFSFLVLLVV